MTFTAEEMAVFRKVGAMGGRQRAANLTAKQLSDGGKKAIKARWDKSKTSLNAKAKLSRA